MGKVHSLPDKWLPVSIAPANSDLEVCVMDKFGFHALVFPVRKGRAGWVDSSTRKTGRHCANALALVAPGPWGLVGFLFIGFGQLV